MTKSVLTLCAISVISLTACVTANAQSHTDLSNARVIKSGTLTGTNGHAVKGTIQIVRHNGQTYAKLSNNFTFDGAPDPYIGFGVDDKYNSDTTVAPLNTFNGAHYYRLPAKIKVSDYEDFFIWCQKFSVPLAHADLK